MALKLSTGLRNKLLGINTSKISGDNSDFDTITGDWTAVTATPTSEAGGQSGNCLKLAESGDTDPGKYYYDVTTKIGHLYMFEVYFKKGDADNGKFMIGETGDEDAIYDSGNLNDAAWTLYRIWFLATDTTTRVTLQTNDATAGEYSLFDEVQFVSQGHSIQDIFKDGFVEIWSGAQPSSADKAPTGTLLVRFYSDGASAGLEFDDAASGVISKAAAETWSGTAVATGTAGWFRLKTAGDLGTENVTDERIDGLCATSGAEMNMSSTTITSGAVQSLSTFQLTLPASA